eukprot:3286406-Pleurochrysis_carterae.AAC.2
MRHPTCFIQLPHASVDKRVASQAARPFFEELACLIACRIAPTVARGVERAVAREEAHTPAEARKRQKVAHDQLMVHPICRAVLHLSLLVLPHLFVQPARRQAAVGQVGRETRRCIECVIDARRHAIRRAHVTAQSLLFPDVAAHCCEALGFASGLRVQQRTLVDECWVHSWAKCLRALRQTPIRRLTCCNRQNRLPN